MRHYIFTALVYAVLCGSNIQAVEANVTEEDVTQEEKDISDIINAKNEKGEYTTSLRDLLATVNYIGKRTMNWDAVDEIKEIVNNNPHLWKGFIGRDIVMEKLQKDLAGEDGKHVEDDTYDFIVKAFKKRFYEETSKKEVRKRNINERLAQAQDRVNNAEIEFYAAKAELEKLEKEKKDLDNL